MTEAAVLLHADDRHRMTRLYEEVLTRLEEMAMITARNLGMNAGAGFDVAFRPLTAATIGDFHAVEVVRGLGGSGCYDYHRGVCFQHGAKDKLSD
jgi:hypothetical protein